MSRAVEPSQSASRAATVVCETCLTEHPLDGRCRGTEPQRLAQAPEPRRGAARAESLAGQTLGDYRVLALLGRGGMGSVYLAEHRIVGSLVALKALHADLATQPQHAERFRNEARMLDRVGHENIVSVFELFSPSPERLFLTMELLEGRTLSALMGAPLPPAKSLPILLQICDALEAAHAVGVIHRDLKPDNVLLVSEDDDAPQIRLVDFGVALLAGGTPDGLAGGIVGTPEFMAPEQWDEQPVDGRTDLYALGAIAYAMAVGRPPFAGSPVELYRAHRLQPPQPPSERVSIPAAYEAFVLKALAKRPEDRFQSARELRGVLEALQREVAPSSAGRAHSPDHEREAQRLLASCERCVPGDHYALLGLPEDAECVLARRQARRAVAKLQRLAEQLPAGERERADVVLERLQAAASVIGEPAWRAAFDAEHGNFRGVAQCLGAGLGAERLAGLRRNFLAVHPERAETARAHLTKGASAERDGRREEAVAEYERALGEDPLAIEAHERYWPLARSR